MQTVTSPGMTSIRPFIYFSQMVEVIHTPPIFTDLSGVLVVSNYDVKELFGYGFNEMHGSSIGNI